MHWFTAVVLFVLIWWTVLFAVLPVGTRPIADARGVPGGWRGAPERPMLMRKILATTAISVVLWAAAFALVQSDWLSFRHGIFAMPDE